MTGTILPEIADYSLRPLEAALEREGDDTPSIGVEMLNTSHALVVGLIANLWRNELSALRDGAFGHEFLRTTGEFLEALERAKRLGNKIEAIATKRGKKIEEFRPTLEATEAVIDAHIEEINKYRSPLLTPPSAELLEKVKKAASRPNKKYVSGDDIMARVQSETDL
jgi:hypothetical protein